MSLAEIRDRVARALERAGRAPDSVTLIAVSKTQPLDRVTDALDQGQRVFGENRVQEAAGKWPALRERYGPVDLHLLGPLQSNKIGKAFELFDAIHSLDREKLASRLAAAAQEAGRCPELFVQVNTGREPQKAGLDPDAVDAFLSACREVYDLPVAGLMVIPPFDADPAPHFAMLRAMAERNGIAGLSMGMSDDFEIAIAEGATHVRVGSAIFGARQLRT
ncbi:YggS family pyridoxal phosphate-dependent enzyme [Amaricoccus solimangrovi]|uniref:Pyridoxal phosphate homeostasis protein n=1 Tax=Amaricoccus solimangrovi TaxID=2589815 RepID=A0A501WUS5_9RHOB|nr:YggS family pyridoxal phosphate-dependent enzyme [Amaricoccus solimangrovi]TPE52065.1 YggS family pyridoxal phosphate-dependent enzyme [Amaricoccus solimangrovi]